MVIWSAWIVRAVKALPDQLDGFASVANSIITVFDTA